MATTATEGEVVHSESPIPVGPVAPSCEAVEGSRVSSGEGIWGKKFGALQRKCAEYEQLNNALFARAVKMHQMIERTETEKLLLIKRLQHFQDVELPEITSRDSSPCAESVIAEAASKIRSELDAELSATQESTNSQSSKGNATLPALLRAHPGEATAVDTGPSTPKGLASNGHTTTPKQHPMSSPAASIILTPTLVSATVPIVMSTTSSTVNVMPPTTATTKAKRATKGSRRDTNAGEKGPTTKRRKADVDPNAPKKPSNAFFWFCQEKRASLQEQFRGEGMAGQHDLTKALARRWSETNIEDRKVYYDRYAVDKARYDKEMEEYNRSKQSPSVRIGVVIQPVSSITAAEQ